MVQRQRVAAKFLRLYPRDTNPVPNCPIRLEFDDVQLQSSEPLLLQPFRRLRCSTGPELPKK